jgi:CheY-like chemotaxis protein
LIVDDDKTFRLSLSEGLKELEKGYHIVAAGNGKEAVRILKSRKIDLVITDLKMPVMDGFELIAHIRNHFPELPCIVITAFGNPEIESGVKQLGAVQYTEKPIDFDVLVQKIADILSNKSHGFVRGISLPSFLHLIELENKTCTLTVQAKGKKGFLHFMGGVLINASTGKMSGVEAAMNILAWETGEIEIEGKNVKKEKTIDLPLNYLILEAMRRKDESSKQDSQEPESESSQSDDMDVNINKKTNKKENQMKSNVLSEIVESIKSEMGDGLIATDVWMVADGQSLAGYNTQPKACALFNQVTSQLKTTLERSNFPSLGEFYLLKLADGKIVTIVSHGDFLWGILADSAKVQLGLLINIVVPIIVDGLKKGSAG